jgi:hypothetical protein
LKERNSRVAISFLKERNGRVAFSFLKERNSLRAMDGAMDGWGGSSAFN